MVGSGEQRFKHASVHVFQRVNKRYFDMLVNLVNAAVRRPELHYLRTNLCNEAAIRRAAGRGKFRANAGFVQNGLFQRVRQRAARREEWQAADAPGEVVIERVFVKNSVDAALQTL